MEQDITELRALVVPGRTTVLVVGGHEVVIDPVPVAMELLVRAPRRT